MHTEYGRTVSLWMATTKEGPQTPLTEDTAADACIVGAGIAGLTTAYLLTKEGKSVIVLDDGPIGGGESGRTTAHLTTALDERYIDLEKMHGVRSTPLIAKSHAVAIDTVERIVAEEKIDCDFARVDGYLVLTKGEPRTILEEELEAAHRAQLTNIELLEKPPLATFEGPVLRFPRQAQFHIMRYLHGLARAITENGGKIFTSTHADSIKGGADAHVVTSNGHRVRASNIVVATNTPVNDRVVMHTKQAGYTTYVMAFSVPRNSVPKVLLWDTGHYGKASGHAPYHYVRIAELAHCDVLIAGGEDHKTGQAHDAPLRLKRLEDWTRKHFPMAGDVLHNWSGEVMEPADGLAFIGRNPLDSPNVFIATGDSGNGITHGTIAGLLITDLIFNRGNPWEKLYRPSRKPLHALGTFIRENLNTATHYADLVSAGSSTSRKDVAPGSGKILKEGLKRIALYRDPDGTEHAFSAICPHLGCIVAWNDYEKSWDCPCHGSRFSCKGKVVHGPSNSDLRSASQA